MPSEGETGRNGPAGSQPLVASAVEAGSLRRRVTAALEADGLPHGDEERLDARGDARPATRMDAVVVAPRGPAAGMSSPVESVTERFPGARVVAISLSTAGVPVGKLLAAGVDGVVLEADLEGVLATTVRAVCAGQIVVPRKFRQGADKPILSSREKQVLGMVVLGFSNAEIAARLFVAESTVKTHLHSSFKKLGVRSRNEAAARIVDPAGNLGTGILTIPTS